MSQENAERGTRIALRPLSERAGDRRALDDRVFVRFPALYRRMADALMRLSPRSRLRRLMLARAVGQAYAAGNRRDFDRLLIGIDPAEYEYRPASDLMPPDLDPVFTVLTATSSCGDTGSMHSPTSAGTPRRFSTWEKGLWSRPSSADTAREAAWP
jgi:hypothetical protein